jgi:aminoglycoside phosphotransferase (APT) family kinase protein
VIVVKLVQAADPAEQAVHLRVVEAVRRMHSAVVSADNSAGPEDDAILVAAALQQLSGGLTNAVFRYRANDGDYVLKLYHKDERDGIGREWTALGLLDQHLPDCAPRPVLRDQTGDRPAVVMTWLSGQPLGGRQLVRPQFTELRERIMAVHAVLPERLDAAIPAAMGTPGAIIARIQQDGEAALVRRSHAPEASGQRELRALWQDWLRGPDPATLVAPTYMVFSRGDPNLMNCLWDDGRMRLVDFEDSGWSDRATDLADLVEHVQSRGTSDEDWFASSTGSLSVRPSVAAFKPRTACSHCSGRYSCCGRSRPGTQALCGSQINSHVRKCC